VSQLRHAYAQVNGIRMHYVTAGSGPPLLLLHGFPEFWYSWRRQIPALAERFTVIVPDQRGYNETDKPGWGYSVDVLVADVLELMDALGHERADLVGHDWGGAVAWAAGIAYPHRFRRLAILNTPHPAVFAENLRRNWRQRLRSLYMGLFALPALPELLLSANDYALLAGALRGVRADTFSAEDIDAYKDAISTPGALTAALGWYRAAAREGPRGIYRGTDMRCTLPTLLVWAEEDRFLGKELIAGTERYVPDLTVRRIPGCSHWVQQERPDLVNSYLLEFFGGGHR
jgi:pimeloyl-ACP methyl ester carboxylesterase